MPNKMIRNANNNKSFRFKMGDLPHRFRLNHLCPTIAISDTCKSATLTVLWNTFGFLMLVYSNVFIAAFLNKFSLFKFPIVLQWGWLMTHTTKQSIYIVDNSALPCHCVIDCHANPGSFPSLLIFEQLFLSHLASGQLLARVQCHDSRRLPSPCHNVRSGQRLTQDTTSQPTNLINPQLLSCNTLSF